MNLPDVNTLIKGISIKQPYAALMLHGKDETRVWKTSYRGWVLLCSSAKEYDLLQVTNISGIERTARLVSLLSEDLCEPKNGYAFAIGYLTNVVPMTVDDETKCFVTYQEGLYRHIYTHVTPLPIPFPIKGKQLLFNLDYQTKLQVLHQLLP